MAPVSQWRFLVWLILPALVFTSAGCALLRSQQPTPQKLAAHASFTWQQAPANQVILYVEPGSAGERRLDAIRADVVQAQTHILALLGAPAYNDTLHVFIVDSREKMERLIGAETNGIAFPDTGVLCYIVSDDMMLSARHEMLHVVAMNLWGAPARWINEGLAVYADDHWHNHDLQALTTHLSNNGRLLPLEQLTGDFLRQNDLIAYPQAGSFVKYIYQTYGRTSIEQLWKQGIEHVEEITGKDLHTLEVDWLAWARQKEDNSIDYLIN